MTTASRGQSRGRWWQRKPKPEPIDYIGLMREAGCLHDQIRRCVRDAERAVADGNLSGLASIEVEVERKYDRMRQIEAEVSAR